ncbi:amidohydrolase [Mesonia ostreae]|uniref:Amidohydrolase n=1 Tax=Mesonia ostreae TaxID=861110 RepID=A0ABU2KJM5_9FLAO|nr:amidohydrolase [Mesonia ostreae]MDT0294920.1 amidohydrolase [Mesonia ostreae]
MKKIIYLFVLLTVSVNCKDVEKKSEIKTTESSAQLYHNGDILTMDDPKKSSYAEVLVEEYGKIVFVGDKAKAEEKYAEAKKIDLQGKTLLPGFIDPHSHFGMISNSMGQVDLNPEPVGDVNTIEAIKNHLKAYKKDNNIPDDEWIVGWGYDDGQLEEKRHPTKQEIDAVLPNNPVYLMHTSGHMGVANSAALKLLNVNADSPDPDGGTIVRMENSKEPNGLVQETAMYPFMGTVLEIAAKNQAKHFDATQEYYASNGITTAQDGMTDRNSIAFFKKQAAAGKLKIDLIALGGNNDLKTNLADSTIHFKKYNNHFKVQGTKIVADGSPQGKTAFFTEPFKTEVPGCTHDCRGLPSLSKESLNDLFVTAYKNDNQLFIHSNGDATIDMVIAAHENACEQLGQELDKDRRTIVIHSQFVRSEQLEIFKEYNIEPSFFTNHAFFWGDEHVKNLGKRRAFFLSPIASAEKLGLKYTNHSDATVTPIDPLFMIWSAVNRVSRTGEVIGPEERATPYQALKAITSHAAYEFFEENYKGSLEEGKLADFVILDKNPLKVEPMNIKEIQVLQTIKEGNTVYKK